MCYGRNRIKYFKKKIGFRKAKKKFKDKTNASFFIKSQTKLENSKGNLERVTVYRTVDSYCWQLNEMEITLSESS